MKDCSVALQLLSLLSAYMTVDDITQAEKATALAGGEITRPSTKIPGVGKLAVVTDASGALIGLIQPDPAHALASMATPR